MPALSIEAETAVIALAETLRVLRLQHGESQALAAQRIGVGLRTYQLMESSGRAAGQVGIPAGGVAIGDYVMALEVRGGRGRRAHPTPQAGAGQNQSSTRARPHAEAPACHHPSLLTQAHAQLHTLRRRQVRPRPLFVHIDRPDGVHPVRCASTRRWSAASWRSSATPPSGSRTRRAASRWTRSTCP